MNRITELQNSVKNEYDVMVETMNTIKRYEHDLKDMRMRVAVLANEGGVEMVKVLGK
jgi:hypothetical protein